MRKFLLSAIIGAYGLLGVIEAGASQDFMVFFAEGKPDRLDPEQWRVSAGGESVIKEAVVEYKRRGGFILLAGHDQRVGTAEDALIRSQRRANAVKKRLIAHGVPARALATKACGQASPLVETAPGVAEPQNRYVMFWWRPNVAEIAEAAAGAACMPLWKRID